ncbi:PPC domain-containing protein [Pyxidicoccus parkwayensis]|jgi:Bacterial pre-peptidase C-terminal domain|uniref:PPC domain-containing protein n=1 Tax=Pyxidicoccus parkwayensis TaxID=2813578 RepID=A0ABX7NK02_9BACT|nr:PPC domain-containing protein [Pyxidicoccus parkwaysis]QSQ19166.1 PPC domain-containing protein [Pyxidicoccus parkwaysis]
MRSKTPWAALVLAASLIVGCGESPEIPDNIETEATITSPWTSSPEVSAMVTPRALYNGYPLLLSGGQASEQFFRFVNPAPAPKLRFTLRGGTGDADLYVREWAEPTRSVYDCASRGGTNTENCEYSNVSDEVEYYVQVYGYSTFSNARLHAYYAKPFADGESAIINGATSSREIWEVDIPPNQKHLLVTFKQDPGMTGQFNLYLRQNEAPELPTADCSTASDNGTVGCLIFNPAPGKAYILIEGRTFYTTWLTVDVVPK